jgi:sugar/nucleoside kinase (ribokinase family)
MDEPDRYDVFVQGTVFLDIVLTGLESAPTTGTEIFAEGMGSCPGGVANFAIAASRLGLKTGLAAVFGDDVYARRVWTCPTPAGSATGTPRSRSRCRSTGTAPW